MNELTLSELDSYLQINGKGITETLYNLREDAIAEVLHKYAGEDLGKFSQKLAETEGKAEGRPFVIENQGLTTTLLFPHQVLEGMLKVINELIAAGEFTKEDITLDMQEAEAGMLKHKDKFTQVWQSFIESSVQM